MVTLASRRARAEIVSLLDAGRARNSSIRQFAFGDTAGRSRYIPHHPMQDIIRATAKDGVDVVEDEGIGLSRFGRARKLEARLSVSTTPGELLWNNSSVRPRVGSHEQRRNIEASPAAAACSARSASLSAARSAALPLRRSLRASLIDGYCNECGNGEDCNEHCLGHSIPPYFEFSGREYPWY